MLKEENVLNVFMSSVTYNQHYETSSKGNS